MKVDPTYRPPHTGSPQHVYAMWVFNTARYINSFKNAFDIVVGSGDALDPVGPHAINPNNADLRKMQMAMFIHHVPFYVLT